MNFQRGFHGFAVLATAFLFGGAGIAKLFGMGDIVQRMAEMNFGIWATRGIGALEVLAACAIFFRTTRSMALLALWPVSFGAIGAHFTAGHSIDRWGTAIVGAVLVGCALTTFNEFKVQMYKAGSRKAKSSSRKRRAA